MSISTAIKAVTEKLRERLLVADADVTAVPPDKAVEDRKLNLFLYSIVVNSAWRNQDLPTKRANGQPSRPLLPLNLYYLISAFADDFETAHECLGKAMLSLHDRPELEFSWNSSIRSQVDPIRITQHPLNLDEMSKLWSSFQTAYRPSVAYEVGVVLIESEQLETPPLPVLRRGSDDRGWDATTLLPAWLESIRFTTPNQSGARLGEAITLVGQNFNRPGVIEVEFHHPLSNITRTSIDTRVINDREIRTTIPDPYPVPDLDQESYWPAGVYLVSVRNTQGTGFDRRTYTSNSHPMSLLPEIEVPEGGLVATLDNGKRSLLVRCKPRLQPKQRAQVLVASNAFDPVVKAEMPNPSFRVVSWSEETVEKPLFKPGEIRAARLRVDGIESLAFDPTKPEQGFDPKYTVQFPE